METLFDTEGVLKWKVTRNFPGLQDNFELISLLENGRPRRREEVNILNVLEI
jgi:hypothetical protein